MSFRIIISQTIILVINSCSSQTVNLISEPTEIANQPIHFEYDVKGKTLKTQMV